MKKILVFMICIMLFLISCNNFMAYRAYSINYYDDNIKRREIVCIYAMKYENERGLGETYTFYGHGEQPIATLKYVSQITSIPGRCEDL